MAFDTPVKPEPAPAGWRAWRDRVLQHEPLNFALTNHVPRAALTLLMGRLSRIDSPAFTRLALAVWRLFADLDLSDAAPAALHVRRVRYVSGDVFNVNPPALRRIPGLFCRNERALIEATLPDGSPIALVPVAAILVASIRLHFLDVTLHLRWRGPHELLCDAHLSRGQEMGWFEHGSTIILFVPAHWRLADGIEPGRTIRAGQALWRREA